jgi:hypothetical protein
MCKLQTRARLQCQTNNKKAQPTTKKTLEDKKTS